MAILKNRAGVVTPTAGTGTITLGAALTAAQNPNAASWQTFAAAGVANGDQVRYLILDSNGAWEYGPGTYTSAGTTLSRASGAMNGTVPGQKSSTGSLLALSGTAQVFITAVGEDIGAFTASATAPLVPVPGDIWYDLNSGMISIYVFDGNSSQWVQIGGGSLGTPSLGVVLRVFTTSQSYVPTPGTQFAIVDLVGGGGGGGGVQGATSNYYSGAGGGAGGFARARLTAAQIFPSIAATIGTGGAGGVASANGLAGTATSLGGLVVAGGGSGGLFGSVAQNATGGFGGTATVGDLLVPGMPGFSGYYNAVSNTQYLSVGAGGSTRFGSGGQCGAPAGGASVAGFAATGYGSGGGGAIANGPNSATGGAGAPGIIVITEYVVTVVTVVGSPTTVGGPPQGRLTLVTQTPVMTATASAVGSVFYTPYVGDKIPLYDGVNWLMTLFSELSCLTTDTAKNPAAIGASKVNDWFVWNDAGTVRLSHGPDWTNDTTRSGGTALTRLNGTWLNSLAITNGPGALRGTYVGTTRSNASSQLDWIQGSSAVSGGAAFLGVWNCYNRVTASTVVQDTTTNWTAGSGVTRPLNNSTTNRISAVFGLPEEVVIVNSVISGRSPTGHISAGIGVNSTTVMSGAYSGNALTSGNTPLIAEVCTIPVGFSFWQWLEACSSNDGLLFGTTSITVPIYANGLSIKARM